MEERKKKRFDTYKARDTHTEFKAKIRRLCNEENVENVKFNPVTKSSCDGYGVCQIFLKDENDDFVLQKGSLYCGHDICRNKSIAEKVK